MRASQYFRLIASIRKIVVAIRSLERHINGTTSASNETITHKNQIIPKESLTAFRSSLETKCPIPLDLLDLLDVGNVIGMNPQIYVRGLMKESIRQLMGLERRKRGLGMLADAIEVGMKCSESEVEVKAKSNEDRGKSDGLNKRKREECDESEHVVKKERN